MSKLDFISKLFIDNSKKLDERPPDAVWKRLESRLDSRKAQKSLNIYRYVAVAAILLSMASAVALMQMSKKHERQLAQKEEIIQNQENPAPTSTQPTSEPAAKSPKKAPIESPAVVSSSGLNKMEERDDVSPIRALGDPVLIPEDVYHLYDYKSNDNDDVRFNAQNNTTNLSLSSSDRVSASSPIPATNPYSFDAAPQEFPQKPSLSKPFFSGTPASEADKMEVESKYNPRQDEEMPDGKYRLSNKLAALEWLIGEWGDVTHEGINSETWTVRHSFEIQGNATHVLGKDTIFNESLSIFANEMGVFYVADVGYTMKQLKFRLRYNDAKKFVFEQVDADGMPNEVIIEKVSHKKMTITTRFNNGQLSMEQQNFLKNRNKVNNNTAVRTLTRR